MHPVIGAANTIGADVELVSRLAILFGVLNVEFAEQSQPPCDDDLINEIKEKVLLIQKLDFHQNNIIQL
jgi:hypothetical protein